MITSNLSTILILKDISLSIEMVDKCRPNYN